MKISVGVGGYTLGNTSEMEAYVAAAERLGVDSVWSAEAWGQDAVTVLAFLAAKTSRIKLGTGIMQSTARVPSMTAMTAMSLNELSNGRFMLGLGSSGPQVVEGLQGVSYQAPLTRLKETVEICRMAFTGEKIRYAGSHHVLPRPGGEGKAMRLSHEPAEIPIYLATLGPKALEYTGAAADGWLGHSFSPDHPEAMLDFIGAGAAKAGRELAEIDLITPVGILIGENVEELINSRKPGIAFSCGAMGSENTNFYLDAIARAGYVDDAKAVQQLWLQGKRAQAVERVPDAMVSEFAAVGTADMVTERLKKYRDVGVTTLSLRIEGETLADRIALLEESVDLIHGIQGGHQ
jgi:F420-dependent oxidoreductase-like protein